MDDLCIFTGNANRPLAGAICRELGIPLAMPTCSSSATRIFLSKLMRMCAEKMSLSSNHSVHRSTARSWNC